MNEVDFQNSISKFSVDEYIDKYYSSVEKDEWCCWHDDDELEYYASMELEET